MTITNETKTLSMDEVLEMDARGELNQWDVYSGGAWMVDGTNVDRFLAVFREDALPTYLRMLTHPTLSLTNPDPAPADVKRAQSAVRGWLQRNPQYQQHVAPEFLEADS